MMRTSMAALLLASPVERNRTVQSRNPIMADLISMVFIAHPLYATESGWQVWGAVWIWAPNLTHRA